MKPAFNRIPMEGKKYNRLTVIEYSHTKGKRAFWKCICDCGQEKVVSGAELRHNHTKSCGCLRKEADISYLVENRSKRKRPFGDSAFLELYQIYRKSAIKRSYIFELSKEEFRSLTKQNCNYCNIEPKQKYQKPTLNGHYLYNGIDRVDNSTGYTIINCVPCCGICNGMKMGRSQLEFKQMIKKIYEHLDLK